MFCDLHSTFAKHTLDADCVDRETLGDDVVLIAEAIKLKNCLTLDEYIGGSKFGS